jgi:hypothetical protein
MYLGSHILLIDNYDRLAGIYVIHIKMAENVEREFGTISEKYESTFSDADINTQEVKRLSPNSEIIKSSTGRKSFSKRRSACFGSLGVYLEV